MAYFHYMWSDEIEAHLREHHVSPEEFEEVCDDPDRRGFSRSTGKPAAWGRTSKGRRLIVIYEMEDDQFTIIPATAFDV